MMMARKHMYCTTHRCLVLHVMRVASFMPSVGMIVPLDVVRRVVSAVASLSIVMGRLEMG
jgi:hypothetical protein